MPAGCVAAILCVTPDVATSGCFLILRCLVGAFKEKDLGKMKAFAQDIMQKISANELRPVVCTSCHRTAFQSNVNNDVRISLDYPLYCLKEVRMRAITHMEVTNVQRLELHDR